MAMRPFISPADPFESSRDLKPSNIMLSNNSQGVLLDFGSMTPASIEMTTRSEAQRWQVSDHERERERRIDRCFTLGLGGRKLLCSM